MNISRGDRFDYLVSVSSPSRSLDLYREQTVPKDSPKWKEKYIAGDMNTTMIKTANGLTIKIQHDTSTPRPYDRINLIQGTKGLFRSKDAETYVVSFMGFDAASEKRDVLSDGERSSGRTPRNDTRWIGQWPCLRSAS